jgi:hypothetical protein
MYRLEKTKPRKIKSSGKFVLLYKNEFSFWEYQPAETLQTSMRCLVWKIEERSAKFFKDIVCYHSFSIFEPEEKSQYSYIGIQTLLMVFKSRTGIQSLVLVFKVPYWYSKPCTACIQSLALHGIQSLVLVF